MEFSVIDTSEHAQTARMVLRPRQSSGGKENEHAQSEQVLYLSQGRLQAEVGERRFTLEPGDSVIVPKGCAHRFENAGDCDAVTFNVYVPPAY